MAVKEELMEILRCPACVAGKEGVTPEEGKLNPEGETMLVCRSCGRKFPVDDGVPDMTLEEGLAGH
jgi:uncharacterized protein YbaR (Trm112 family)